MRVWGCTFHLIFWGHRTVSVQEHKTGQKEGLRGADRKERGIKWIKQPETARRGDATQCRTKNEIHSPFFTAFSHSTLLSLVPKTKNGSNNRPRNISIHYFSLVEFSRGSFREKRDLTAEEERRGQFYPLMAPDLRKGPLFGEGSLFAGTSPSIPPEQTQKHDSPIPNKKSEKRILFWGALDSGFWCLLQWSLASQ